MNTKKIDLIDVALIFAKKKHQFFTVLVIITLIGIISAFIWPKTYRSELTFVVNSGNSLNLSSGGLLSGLANLSIANQEITADQILIILRSRKLLDELIEEFDLEEVYSTDIKEALRKKLSNNILIEDFREGGIGLNSIIATNVAIISDKPERAFEMLNYYFSKLDSVIKELNESNIETGYLMLESRLNKNLIDLKIAEDSLRSFQEKNGILEIEGQTKAIIESISTIKAEIVALDIQISTAKTLYLEKNSGIEELEMRKMILEEKYNSLLSEENSLEERFDIYKPLDIIPGLLIEYIRRLREVEVQQEIYKILYPQYEQQKLNYNKVSSGLKIIDPPNFPTYKDGPKRAYIMIAFFLFGSFLGVLIIFFSHWKEKAQSEKNEDFQRFQELIRSIKFR